MRRCALAPRSDGKFAVGLAGFRGTLPSESMAQDNDRNATPDTVAELRGHASALQREIDRRILVEGELACRLDALGREATVPDALFRLLVDTVEDYAIFMLDPHGNVATWSTGAQRIKGYRANEIIGRHFSAFYPEGDVLAGKCDLELEIATREGRFEEEGWRVRKDGSRFWANVVITALRDATGALIGFGKVTRDLTERKVAEEQRRFQEQRFALLVGSVKDYALFILDPTAGFFV